MEMKVIFLGKKLFWVRFKVIDLVDYWGRVKFICLL